jgi:hypothetical protein
MPDSDRLTSFLDALEERSDGLLVTGWAFFTDDASGVPASVDVVLRGEGPPTVRRAQGMLRADVATAHGLEHDMVGFTTVVPRSDLPPSPFEVRLCVRTSSGAAAERLLGRWAGDTCRRPMDVAAGAPPHTA